MMKKRYIRKQVIKDLNSTFWVMKKTAEKNYLKAVPAWLSLILAAHRVQLWGARRESPSWWFVRRSMPLWAKPEQLDNVSWKSNSESWDLKKKMVFVSGPRQVGKTTLAKSILTNESSYLNWDIPVQREAILRRELPVAKLWCFDEIHKYNSWRD